MFEPSFYVDYCLSNIYATPDLSCYKRGRGVFCSLSFKATWGVYFLIIIMRSVYILDIICQLKSSEQNSALRPGFWGLI